MQSAFNKTIICPILVGRTPHLSALSSYLDQAQLGQGQTILLSGEAGIGKSRLVAEVKRLALQQGFTLLQGNCLSPIVCYRMLP